MTKKANQICRRRFKWCSNLITPLSTHTHTHTLPHRITSLSLIQWCDFSAPQRGNKGTVDVCVSTCTRAKKED